MDDLRSTLLELASQAEIDECMLVKLSSRLFGHRDNDTTLSASSLSRVSFSSPLGFLQAALPHIPTEILRRALNPHGGHVEDIDMEAIIEGLLTDEYLRELEARGYHRLDEGGEPESVAREANVETGRRSGETKTRNRRARKGTTISLGDVRQTQPALLPPTRLNRARSLIAPARDPWTQLSSLATHISSLLPPYPPSFFLSFFHSPEYSTPYDALRAALTSLCAEQSTSSQQTALLSGILDILLPSQENLDPQQRLRLVSDSQLALDGAQGRGEDALDLAILLHDLYSDSAPDRLRVGVYHSSVPEPCSRGKLPKSPEIFSSSPLPVPHQLSPSPSAKSPKPNPFQWQTVPVRKAPLSGPNPLSAFIPAYNNISSNGSGGGNTGELSFSQQRKRIGERMKKRNDLLRQASQAWQKGNAETRGGEVALYFAERVRSLLL